MSYADHMDNDCEHCGFPLQGEHGMHERESCFKELIRQRQQMISLRWAVNLAVTAIKGELERGYVLTEEPGAGPAWRRRWNNVLGRLEEALLAPRKP